MNERLIELLRTDEDEICDAWRQRLSETACFAALKVVGHTSNPVRPLLHDLVRALEGHPPTAETLPCILDEQPFGSLGFLQIRLSQCVEVFLTGEVVVRRWARTHLDVTDAEFLELFEQLNRATHELLRHYTLRYCENCRPSLATAHAPADSPTASTAPRDRNA